MNNGRPNKSSMLFMILIFLGLNGVVLFFISEYTNIQFLILAVIFVVICILIDVIKRIRNHIILSRIKAEEQKRIEEIMKYQEEQKRIKEERRQLAIKKQKARNDAMRKSGKKKGK